MIHIENNNQKGGALIMPTCYFNNDLNKGFPCEYEIKDENICVDVEYDIEEEIPDENGIKVFSANTFFDKRDILVVDSAEKKSYLLKNAIYNGTNGRYGSLDDVIIAKLTACEFFVSDNFRDLIVLPPEPEVKMVRIYSDVINECYQCKGVSLKNEEERINIVMSKDRNEETADIYSNNIEKILLGDDWNYTKNNKKININMESYLGIVFTESVSYKEIFKYIYEATVYIQLYYPDKNVINKILLNIEDKNYIFVSKKMRPVKYSDKHIDFSVKDSFLMFLKNCYTKIPYRDTESATRNIPYVVMNSYRGIEDNFLMFFRFIEYLYKSRNSEYEQRKLIEDSITEHYKDRILDDKVKKKEAREIVGLRNHYVHDGYYIHDSKLLISFKRRKRTPNDYYVDADVNWIYEKTKMLYSIVIDIIFREMLEYGEYIFDKGI